VTVKMKIQMIRGVPLPRQVPEMLQVRREIALAAAVGIRVVRLPK